MKLDTLNQVLTKKSYAIDTLKREIQNQNETISALLSQIGTQNQMIEQQNDIRQTLSARITDLETNVTRIRGAVSFDASKTYDFISKTHPNKTRIRQSLGMFLTQLFEK